MEKMITENNGAIYTEYALLAVFIAAAAVGAVRLFGESVLAVIERFPLSIFK